MHAFGTKKRLRRMGTYALWTPSKTDRRTTKDAKVCPWRQGRMQAAAGTRSHVAVAVLVQTLHPMMEEEEVGTASCVVLSRTLEEAVSITHHPRINNTIMTNDRVRARDNRQAAIGGHHPRPPHPPESSIRKVLRTTEATKMTGIDRHVRALVTMTDTAKRQMHKEPRTLKMQPWPTRIRMAATRQFQIAKDKAKSRHPLDKESRMSR